ncbi:hypothetical protein MIR68_010668 [Amoeboaphelidium protococcarum]|nr:hypothetical protein MIR68_010668 [Amoeboaphelidium protococcarum]
MANIKKQVSQLDPHAPSLPVKFLGINVQFHAFYLISALVMTLIVSTTALSRREGQSWLDDLFNGSPKPGQLGLGIFDIVGYTFPFMYPFRQINPSVLSIMIPWACFITHLSGQWYLIYQARAAKLRGEIDWSDGPEWNPYAREMLRWNVFFTIVHFFQTHMYYDGLSAVFPSISALFSGVTSLAVVYIFRCRTRGFILNWTPQSFKQEIDEFGLFLKEYHGYISIFGITVNFWHHPMEVTLSHATGFFHTFLLYYQSSLLYQRGHSQKYWTFFLEIMIWVHGATVAYCQNLFDGILFKMFFSSFLLLVCLGPMWSLPVVQKYLEGDKQNVKYRRLLVAVFVPLTVLVVLLYTNPISHLSWIWQVTNQPMLYYLLFAFYYAFYRFGKWVNSVVLQGKFKMSPTSNLYYSVLAFLTALPLAVLMTSSALIYGKIAPKH